MGRPKPIQKAQSEGSGKDHEPVETNSCDKNSGKKQGKDHEKHSGGQAESVGMGLLFSQHGECDSDGRIDEKS